MLPSLSAMPAALAERLIDLERALVVRERLLVLAERGEHDAHVVERARLVARHADRAIDDERLGVALDRLLELADVPQRRAALVEDRRARDEHRRRRARRRRCRRCARCRTSASACSTSRSDSSALPTRRAIAARRRSASASSERVLGIARVLQRGRGGAQRGGRLADVDVELGERAVRGGELAGLAERVGFLAQRVQLAQLLRALREPAQDLLAQAVRGEPALVIARRAAA